MWQKIYHFYIYSCKIAGSNAISPIGRGSKRNHLKPYNHTVGFIITPRHKHAVHQPLLDSCPPSCTLTGWMSRGHLRTATSEGRAGWLGINAVFVHFSAHWGTSIHIRVALWQRKLTSAHFQSEDGDFSSSPHPNAPHRDAVPEAKVLTG